jgi:NAD(P)-dependent dehydrogenase (short-subunit alcohol dehydrogenase family)
MSHNVIDRVELDDAILDLGGVPMELSDYATTGLRVVAIGPSGSGKTGAGLLIAEQLAAQGWICVLVDPEGEIASMYGDPVTDVEHFRAVLTARETPFVVVSATDATEFLGYGEVLLEVADTLRKPIFVVIDEGQLFSASRKGGDADLRAATELVRQIASRGRKRALDLFVTSLGFTSSLDRNIFTNKNLTLVGCQQDSAQWGNLSPMFRGTGITFADLTALGSGEFYCVSKSGVRRVKLPMAQALSRVARKARKIHKHLPRGYREWVTRMSEIPLDRLEDLSNPVVRLLSSVAGLSAKQVASGEAALADEIGSRA